MTSKFYAPEATHLVFVYGSLLQGFHNHRHLAGALPLGDAVTASRDWRMLDLGSFPALQQDDEGGEVVGELYRVSGPVMAGLDRLEGYPRFYNRRRVAVRCHGTTHDAWVYFVEGELSGALVESRDWRKYKAK